jgi:hypothetical protein
MEEIYQEYIKNYTELSKAHRNSKLQELPPSKDPKMLDKQILALGYCIRNNILMMETPYLIYWGKEYVDDAKKPLDPYTIDGETYY